MKIKFITVFIILFEWVTLNAWEVNTHRAIDKTALAKSGNKVEATRTVKVLMDINVHCKVVGLR